MKTSSRIGLMAAMLTSMFSGGAASPGFFDNNGPTARTRVTNTHPMITSSSAEIREWNRNVDLRKAAKRSERMERRREVLKMLNEHTPKGHFLPSFVYMNTSKMMKVLAGVMQTNMTAKQST